MSLIFSRTQKLISRLAARQKPSGTIDSKRPAAKRLAFELLEPRCMLSGNQLAAGIEPLLADLGVDGLVADADLVTVLDADYAEQISVTEEAGISLPSIQVRVNSGLFETHQSGDPIDLRGGDTLEVVGTTLQLADAKQSTFVLEGYLEKTSEGERVLDLADGRFSPGLHLSSGTTEVSGLQGGWMVDSSCDRLRINVVRYQGESVEIVHSFSVELRVSGRATSRDAAQQTGRDGHDLQVRDSVFDDTLEEVLEDWIAATSHPKASEAPMLASPNARLQAVDALMETVSDDGWDDLIAEADRLISGLR